MFILKNPLHPQVKTENKSRLQKNETANGLSPIADKYGWHYGMLAAMAHFCMVTTVPELHGGMCLYNGGFTAALVCLLMVPSLERHFMTKHQRRALKSGK